VYCIQAWVFGALGLLARYLSSSVRGLAADLEIISKETRSVAACRYCAGSADRGTGPKGAV
jgi:hypothetical protein